MCISLIFILGKTINFAVVAGTFKCIIFDCDGVLVDSEPISNRILHRQAQSFGFTKDLDYVLGNFCGASMQQCIDAIEEDIGSPLPDNFREVYRAEMYEAFKRELKPVKGIHKLIEKLIVPFCVASSGPRRKIEQNLQLTGLMEHFKPNIFSCYDIQKWKPDPEIFLYAASNMGYAPHECLVIEDTITGVQAGLAGGFHVLGLVHAHHEHKMKETGVPLFYAMKELEAELTRLNVAITLTH